VPCLIRVRLSERSRCLPALKVDIECSGGSAISAVDRTAQASSMSLASMAKNPDICRTVFAAGPSFQGGAHEVAGT
jgi:hypothetical protein